MSTATTNQPSPPAAATPTPAIYDPILRDFLNPNLTLQDIASRHNTPLLTLVQFYENPSIRAMLDTIIAAINDRAQLLASAGIHAVVQTHYQAIAQAAALSTNQPITHVTTPAQLSVRARILDHSRKSASALLRLSRQDDSATAHTALPPARPRTTRPALAAQRPTPSPSSHSAPTNSSGATTQPAPTAEPDLPQTIPRAAAA